MFLFLLDLSAAFDTVNHSLLLSRLENSFGITGTVLQWFHSYLCGRSQFVEINDTKSSVRDLTMGVLSLVPYVTLHRNLMLKVRARSRHACTKRLACRRSRICAY